MRRWPAVPRRSSGIWFAVCALAFWGAAVPAVTSAAETWVRSESPKVRAAIAFAKERSATFRRLPESLDSTDGLVFIIEGACPRGVGACLHLSVEIAGPRRLLWVFVNPR